MLPEHGHDAVPAGAARWHAAGRTRESAGTFPIAWDTQAELIILDVVTPDQTRRPAGFCAVKSAEQQAALSLHRTRDLLVRQRTQLVNMIRGLLAEFGIVIPDGVERALGLARQIQANEAMPDVPATAEEVLSLLGPAQDPFLIER
jgi:hypothetical protein